jgi:hypothetical protein
MAGNFSNRALPDIRPRVVASIHNRSASAAIICHKKSPALQLRNFNLWRTRKSVPCCGPADIPSRRFVSFLFILVLPRVTRAHK